MRKITFIILVCLLFSACRTTGPGPDRTVLDHQRQIVELEARNQDLERRLAQYDKAVGASVRELSIIRARSVTMEGTVDDIIGLFGQYQRAVDELARAYNRLKNQAQ